MPLESERTWRQEWPADIATVAFSITNDGSSARCLLRGCLTTGERGPREASVGSPGGIPTHGPGRREGPGGARSDAPEPDPDM